MLSFSRLKVGILLGSLAAAITAVSLLLPGLLDAGKLGKELAERLAAWSGGEVTLSGAPRISYFPDFVVEADGLRIARPDRLPLVQEVTSKTLRIELSPWSALVGAVGINRLVLIGPRISLASEPAREGAASDLLTTVRAAPLSRIGLIDAVLTTGGARSPVLVENLDAELELSMSGALSGHGDFNWRGENLTYSFDTGDPIIQGATIRAPLNLSVAGTLVSASMNGAAVMADAPQLHGALDLSVPHLRTFANWLGMLMPEGSGLDELKAAGAFRWQHGRIAFDQGSFTLDGNTAQGTLAVDLSGARPALAGTLALQQLALQPYFTVPAGAALVPVNAPTADFDPALLRLFDLDLRLSTAEVLTPALNLGQTALSIRLKDGALTADFSVLAVCGGKADGLIEVNAAGFTPRARISGTAAGLAAKPCLEAFIPAPSPIEGTASLTFDLAAAGYTVQEMKASLGGTASLTMSSGQTAIDFAKVFAQAKRRDLRGWESVRGSPTRFESLTGTCAFERGLAQCTSLRAATGIADVAGDGSLDIVTGALDGRLRVSSKVAGPLRHVGKLVSGLLDDVVVEGSWTDPIFRLPDAGSRGSLERRERFAFLRQRI